MYLLVWRDTSSGAHVIQEEPPFQGTHEERQEFLAKWEGQVNAMIDHMHPHVSPRGIRESSATIKRFLSLQGYFHPEA